MKRVCFIYHNSTKQNPRSEIHVVTTYPYGLRTVDVMLEKNVLTDFMGLTGNGPTEVESTWIPYDADDIFSADARTTKRLDPWMQNLAESLMVA